MAFMTPVYVQADFFVVEDERGEHVWTGPADTYGDIEHTADALGVPMDRVTLHTGKIWCQLSANGYMDCTEWDGPHDTLAAAKLALADMWDCDPDTGDDVDDSDEDGAL